MTVMEPDIKNALTVDPDWWRGAVIYQIYPRSYQDSNGDGIGDLAGILQRLPHIASLGVDAIWISPFFTSPMKDFGYDVSDYKDVDPMFGTLADFDALVSEAHKLNLKVMIDLVLSHTSDQHPWFAESRKSRDNDRSDWYVWANAKPDGTPPNNWLSIFGGSAWQWDGERLQYYLHNFLKEQPDLNLHNPKVQDALLDVTRFWLDRGVDGFRLDTINFYFHDKELRDNPALNVDERNAEIAPAVNPYNWQNHVYDKNRPENLEFLKRFRALLNEYDAATSLGEVGDSQRGLEIQAEYTEGGDKVHMCYGFDFLSGSDLDGIRAAETIERYERIAGSGWACWAFSNHDVIRHTTRWQLTPDAHRLYAALLLSLKGTPCVYQGDELGLTEADVAFEDLQDPYGIAFWPEFKGRDGCRTPMPWTDTPDGGFSSSRPWLPMSGDHLAHSVSRQDGDPTSCLNFYKRMLAFRKEHRSLVRGDVAVGEYGAGFLCIERAFGNEVMFAAFNLSDQPRSVSLPDGDWRLETDAPFNATTTDDGLHLPPWQAAFATRT